jgi:hypothetical protein
VRAMLDRGLSEDGAVQALGWPKARVTARVKLLELPERAQQLTGQGVIPLSAVEQLRSIGEVSPELLDAVIGYLGDGNEWAAERLAREPGWVIDSALRNGSSKVFAAHLTQLDSYEIADLRLGKKMEALLDEAATLHKQLDRYEYGAPSIRFCESDVARPALRACSSSSRTRGRSSSTGRSTVSCPSRRSSEPSKSSADGSLRSRSSATPPRRRVGRSIPRPKRGGSAAARNGRSLSKRMARTSISAGG